nr:CoA transferase [Acidimicrobiia bacterium]
ARQLAESEWATARGSIVAVPDRRDGTVRVPNAPWRFSNADVGVRGEPRFRGEDNRAVLVELLGYDDAAIDELEAAAVISSRLPSSGR